MTFSDVLASVKEAIAEFAVLNHPFYQDWNKGLLNREVLQEYAVGYYPHVKAFPQYMSRLHSICPTDSGRQMLLRNLNDEEQG
ncbi:MAG: hypothetical protein KDD43_11980, partial [Bdellovibrionales bacterium]|nr:hypothetical protein [Bdellovibrionales bacterium]